ncbi:MAG: hypothetical protein ACKOAY_10700, partial [Haliscomenobacter sp.]
MPEITQGDTDMAFGIALIHGAFTDGTWPGRNACTDFRQHLDPPKGALFLFGAAGLKRLLNCLEPIVENM